MNLETIIDLVLCHNHKLVPNMVQYMPCHNKIPLHLKRQIYINDEAGIPQCEICYGSSRWCWQSEFDRAKDPYSLAMAMARKGKDLTTGKVTLYSDETIF